ncbi:MAG: hypothetical protein ACLUVC_04440 [Longibaculum sp.]
MDTEKIDDVTKEMEMYENAIQQSCLMDNLFFKIVFRDYRCIQLFKDIVFPNEGDIISIYSKYEFQRENLPFDFIFELEGRHFVGVCIHPQEYDAKTRTEVYQEIELNKASWPNHEWSRLPIISTVIITNEDIFEEGKTIYYVDHDENGEYDHMAQKGLDLIYINTANQDETPIGKFVHDLTCVDPKDMYYDVLKERVQFYKEDRGGIEAMSESICQFEEKARQEGFLEGKKKGKAEMINNYAVKHNISFEEAMEEFGLSKEEKPILVRLIICTH